MVARSLSAAADAQARASWSHGRLNSPLTTKRWVRRNRMRGRWRSVRSVRWAPSAVTSG